MGKYRSHIVHDDRRKLAKRAPITIDGRTQTMTEWAREFGINPSNAYLYIERELDRVQFYCNAWFDAVTRGWARRTLERER